MVIIPRWFPPPLSKAAIDLSNRTGRRMCQPTQRMKKVIKSLEMGPIISAVVESVVELSKSQLTIAELRGSPEQKKAKKRLAQASFIAWDKWRQSM
ncbi:hypothetical protein TYRP_023060 [Tyrophagus putrescentiae]|nr:hypothetical protein TYRP_023060 [Tyrophagus putrescentiae]